MSVTLCSIPILSLLLSTCLPEPPLATGYVEGEYVLVAPVAVAQIVELPVRRGDRVAEGELLVSLERQDGEIALAQARASLAQAQAQLDNMREGLRAEEISVIEANLASARAQAEEYGKEADRLSALVERGAAPRAQLDTARTQLDVANAKVVEIEANLTVARLPARSGQIAAAEATVAQAEAGVSAAEWQLDQRTLYASSDGVVQEILRNNGEIAGPQAPVLSMLPDGAVFVRLYVGENHLSEIEIGTQLDISCDGCGDATATVTYISQTPEFTPPVIYSLENRQKLVYLIEARPDATDLKPGQIVDASLAGAE